MHRAALMNSVQSSRSRNGEAGITAYTKSTWPYDAHSVPLKNSQVAGHKDATATSLTRRSRNQTGPNFESWSPSQTQSKGAWILIVKHIPENILPEA